MVADGCILSPEPEACRSVINGIMTKGLNTGVQYMISALRDALTYGTADPEAVAAVPHEVRWLGSVMAWVLSSKPM